MNILVTGGLGFIGHNVAQKLEQRGHQPIILDNQTTYNTIPKQQIAFLHQERRKKISSNEVHVNHLDQVRVIDWLVNSHNVSKVIHLAAHPRQATVALSPHQASRSMVSDLVSLLESLIKAPKFNHFVYVSSSMVYGDFKSGVCEDACCRPTNLYGILKHTGEEIVKDYAKRHGFHYTIIRPSAVYGELDVIDRVVAQFLIRAIRNETINVNGASEVLDFTHVSDTSEGIVLATLSDNSKNKVYNITYGDRTDHTLLEAAELAVKIAGAGKINIRDKDSSFPSRGNLNISQARMDFGFTPLTNIETGFKQYYEWLISNTVLWS